MPAFFVPLPTSLVPETPGHRESTVWELRIGREVMPDDVRSAQGAGLEGSSRKKKPSKPPSEVRAAMNTKNYLYVTEARSTP